MNLNVVENSEELKEEEIPSEISDSDSEEWDDRTASEIQQENELIMNALLEREAKNEKLPRFHCNEDRNSFYIPFQTEKWIKWVRITC